MTTDNWVYQTNWSPGPGPANPKITPHTVQTIDGWHGQVKVNGLIVWQSKPYTGKTASAKALDKANMRITNKLGDLFA